MMKFNKVMASAMFAVIGSALPVSAANLVLNPGFESGTGADADNWNEIEASGDPVNAVPVTDRTTTSPHTASFAMQLSYSNTATPGTGPNSEIQQQTALNSIVPGTAYDYSFFARRVGNLGAGTVIWAEIQFLDSDGSAGGGVKGSSGLLAVNGLTESYQQYSYTNIIAPANSDAALVMLRVSGGAVPSASATVLADTFSFGDQTVAVPEPASIGLLGLAGLGLLARRRKA